MCKQCSETTTHYRFQELKSEKMCVALHLQFCNRVLAPSHHLFHSLPRGYHIGLSSPQYVPEVFAVVRWRLPETNNL